MSSDEVAELFRNSFEKNALSTQVKELLKQNDLQSPLKSTTTKTRNVMNQSAMSRLSNHAQKERIPNSVYNATSIIKNTELAKQLAHFVKVSISQHSILTKLGYNAFTFDSLEPKAILLKEKLKLSEYEKNDIMHTSILLRTEYRSLRELLQNSSMKYKEEIINMTKDESGFIIIDEIQHKEDKDTIRSSQSVLKIYKEEFTQYDVPITQDEEIQVALISMDIESESEISAQELGKAAFEIIVSKEDCSSEGDNIENNNI